MLKKAKKIISGQSGQTMLIVVLAMVIALTVGLSVVSRSITSLKTTTEEINSQKALAAAEAGIEKALQKLTSTDSPIIGSFDVEEGKKSDFSTTVTNIEGKEIVLNGGNAIGKDEAIDLWLVKHSDVDKTPDFSDPSPLRTIGIYWGKEDDQCTTSEDTNTAAALEISIIYGSLATPELVRYVVDPCSDRRDVNQFELAGLGDSVSGKAFAYGKTGIVVSNGLVARIVPLYASTSIGVISNINLPSQGSVIDSTGWSGSTSRKVTVYQGYPSLPVEYFPNNFFYHNL